MVFDCYKYFTDWEGWTCNICDELLESTERVLIRHLKDKHNIKLNKLGGIKMAEDEEKKEETQEEEKSEETKEE